MVAFLDAANTIGEARGLDHEHLRDVHFASADSLFGVMNVDLEVPVASIGQPHVCSLVHVHVYHQCALPPEAKNMRILRGRPKAH